MAMIGKKIMSYGLKDNFKMFLAIKPIYVHLNLMPRNAKNHHIDSLLTIFIIRNKRGVTNE